MNENWEEVRKDHDASIETELKSGQKLIETKKILYFYKDSLKVTNKEWAETRADLKKKEDELGLANEELTRPVKAEGNEVVKIDPNELEAIKQVLDKSEKRNFRVTDILSKSMEELIVERNTRRELEKRLEEMEAVWASGKVKRVEQLRAELAAASGEYISPPLASAVEMTRVYTDIKKEMVDL